MADDDDDSRELVWCDQPGFADPVHHGALPDPSQCLGEGGAERAWRCQAADSRNAFEDKPMGLEQMTLSPKP